MHSDHIGTADGEVAASLSACRVGAGSGALALGPGLGRVFGWPEPGIRFVDRGGMGVDPADMSRYTEMFNRHSEITGLVAVIPGGIRTATQSNSPDLAAHAVPAGERLSPPADTYPYRRDR